MTTSPCINVCKYIPNTNICQGCFRTAEEIADWATMTADQHLHVKKQAQQRSMAFASKVSPKQQQSATPSNGHNCQMLGY